MSQVFDRTRSSRLLNAMLLPAACALLLANGCGQERHVKIPTDLSWTNGALVLQEKNDGEDLGILVTGSWPKANGGLWIAFNLGLEQPEKGLFTMAATSEPLDTFKANGFSLSDYRKGTGLSIDLAKPYRAVFNYEIWKGEPGSGELLTKQTVYSDNIQHP